MTSAEAAAAVAAAVAAADIKPRPTSPHADALRLTLSTYLQNDSLAEYEDMPGRYETAIALLERFEGDRAAAKSSELFTSIGLVQRVQVLASPLFAAADAMDREAATIADRTDADAARVIAAISAAPTTEAERRACETMVARLELEDVVVREAMFLESCRRGGVYDALTRGVLSATPPPLHMDEARWKNLVTPATLAAGKKLIIERASPLGATAFRGRLLSDIANSLRAAI